MPSIGRLHCYKEPSELPGVRCDSGIEEGSEISMYYDPMICKLTAYGADRNEAIDRSINALDEYAIRGVTHNIPLLRDILTESTFLSGTFTTNYLPETYPDGFQGAKLNQSEMDLLMATASGFYIMEQTRLSGGSPKACKLIAQVLDQQVPVTIQPAQNGVFKVQVDGRELALNEDFSQWENISKVRDNAGEETVQLISKSFDDTYRIRFKGTALNVSLVPEHVAKFKKHMKEKPKVDVTKVVIAPMPGTVKSVSVEVGQMIGEGAECCVLEAMKMQNSLKIGATGKVKAVHVQPGATVQADDVLVELE